MEAQNIIGSIQRSIDKDLTNTTHGPWFQDEYQNIVRCQSHRAIFCFLEKIQRNSNKTKKNV